LPLTDRRARLEARFASRVSDTIRLSEQVRGDGKAMQARAEREHWEGLIAKDAGAPYHSGKRSPAWRKLKILQSQELVIGGWTEPRQTRQYFGALLLGVYQAGDVTGEAQLTYVGHTGTGFNGAELERVAKLLKRSRLRVEDQTNERRTGCGPSVAQVRFTEWTADAAPSVSRPARGQGPARGNRGAGTFAASGRRTPAAMAAKRPTSAPRRHRRSLQSRGRRPGFGVIRCESSRTPARTGRSSCPTAAPERDQPGQAVLAELKRPRATCCQWRHCCCRRSPIGPLMKRFPNGVDGMAFYQQRAHERPPAGVRIWRSTNPRRARHAPADRRVAHHPAL
jgi:hypothetical protein